MVCLYRPAPSVSPAFCPPPALLLPSFSWKLNSICLLPSSNSGVCISLLGCLAPGHQNFCLICPYPQRPSPWVWLAPFLSVQKRNLPLCAQVSPASSRPGNGGDYLLCHLPESGWEWGPGAQFSSKQESPGKEDFSGSKELHQTEKGIKVCPAGGVSTPYTNSDQKPALCWAHQGWGPRNTTDQVPPSRGRGKAEKGQQPVSVEATGKRMDKDSGPTAVATSTLGPGPGKGFGEPPQGTWGHPGTIWPLWHQQGGSSLQLVDQEITAQRK